MFAEHRPRAGRLRHMSPLRPPGNDFGPRGRRFAVSGPRREARRSVYIKRIEAISEAAPRRRDRAATPAVRNEPKRCSAEADARNAAPREGEGDRAGTTTVGQKGSARQKPERADHRAGLRRCVQADGPGGTLSGRICGNIFPQRFIHKPFMIAPFIRWLDDTDMVDF